MWRAACTAMSPVWLSSSTCMRLSRTWSRPIGRFSGCCTWRACCSAHRPWRFGRVLLLSPWRFQMRLGSLSLRWGRPSRAFLLERALSWSLQLGVSSRALLATSSDGGPHFSVRAAAAPASSRCCSWPWMRRHWPSAEGREVSTALTPPSASASRGSSPSISRWPRYRERAARLCGWTWTSTWQTPQCRSFVLCWRRRADLTWSSHDMPLRSPSAPPSWWREAPRRRRSWC
mmetsp:Transcript_60401/g.156179  ORF Transcript_60401/g.156179 Transcript_60401/m.156179 type:complete len:231 (-) Transcript_60401:564-1256(-)